MADPVNPKLRHFTMRRGFVVFLGLLILTLYIMWAGYGAAPTNLSFLTETQSEMASGTSVGSVAQIEVSESEMAMGDMAEGMTPDEFGEVTEKFVEDLSLPDGSVRPTVEWTRQWMAAMSGMSEDGDPAEAMAQSEAASMAPSAETTDAALDREQVEGHGHGEGTEPIAIFMMAMRFSYTPSVLRLKHGVRYRFHMMSMDVNHGASIYSRFGGHIMRRPAQEMVEMIMTFPERGEFVMYCTVYCGLGHGQMKGKIIVE